ncbi:MAG: LytTR family DNA-binding domain-containing protein [Bacteroidota bacterium]|nr:LytTR family DNA-binding domain-containing protein [Bacteroidota bacterium]MDP4245431.1 LytTR family DNA-binding domain-containing protein [Bacteroidota bacterium]MDP4255930.1 LytTR family DNA-binding domain-containing protein [Bacteroidota bacterium]MDP4258535.1 LytTR family DNA-binding domain-containing protein [Bacteroidota bacterium]
MINAIIVDDEPDCSETLSMLLEKCCPDVHVAAICHSGAAALTEIAAHKPDLVFLDIEMPHMNGFQLLEKLPSISFDIVFTTSYDQYAIKAIRFSAMDYLLKPVDREELKNAVDKVSRRHHPPLPQQLEILLQRLHQPTASKIAIPTMEGLQMIPVDSIISCASDSNYSTLHLKGRQKIIASRTLKEIEEMLDGLAFLRVHQSSLVNLNEIDKYVRGEGGYLVMSDGSSINVSRSRKESLLGKLQSRRN